MTSGFKAVIFDFDYTLADSFEGVIQCANHALKGLGFPRATADEIKSTIGLSLPEILAQLGDREHSEKCDEFSALFIEKANEVMAENTVVARARAGRGSLRGG